jgi:preprotein translocase subunit SecF
MLADAFLALLYACIGILLYVALRFDFKFAPGGVIALVHDATITLGFFSFLQLPFSMPVVAAVLTVIGYSINDTIVVFDRIRENIGVRRGFAFERIVNISLNETLSRTLLTSLTVMLVLLAIYSLGGGLIKDFAFALIIGVVVGSYSTLFIASPVLLFLHNLIERRVARNLQPAA